MYCPRCGEQQPTSNLRFCNRCGMQMGLVSELVSNNGILPQLKELDKQKKGWFTRANGLKFSIIWFLFWLIITMLTAIGDGEEGVAVVFVIGLFGSIFLAVFSALFLKGAPRQTVNQELLQPAQNVNQQNLAGQQFQQNALPPQQTQSAQDYVGPGAGSWKAPDTGELVQPGSVTEGTTKLLSKEESE